MLRRHSERSHGLLLRVVSKSFTMEVIFKQELGANSIRIWTYNLWFYRARMKDSGDCLSKVIDARSIWHACQIFFIHSSRFSLSLSFCPVLCSGKMISTYLLICTVLPSGFQLHLANGRHSKRAKGKKTVQNLFFLLLPAGPEFDNGCASLPKSTTSDRQPLSYPYNSF